MKKLLIILFTSIAILMAICVYGLISYIDGDKGIDNEQLQIEIEPLCEKDYGQTVYDESTVVGGSDDKLEATKEQSLVSEAESNQDESTVPAIESIEDKGLVSETESFADERDEAIISDDIEVLHYIDAWNEYHDAIINKSADMHPYNWDYLKQSGQDMSYDDGTWYTRKGIDVSHHQKDIDWEAVKAAGYEFAIIRIGYRSYNDDGVLHWDKNYSEYIKGAKAAGLDVGVYVFSQAINVDEAREEAEMVLHSIAGQKLELPIVYDPESVRKSNARTNDVSGEQFTENTIVFCERIKEAGYTPMIYSNMVWEDKFFDMDILDEYEFWYADYENIPQTPYNFTFWQYACDGKINGIGPNVDLDVQFIRR